MILLAVREKFQIRMAEWLTSTVVLTTSLWMMAFPEIFARPSLIGFTQLASPAVWSVSGAALATLRISALILNGHYSRVSAPMRMVGAMCGTAMFASYTYAFSISFHYHLYIPIFTVLALSDTVNSGRAAIDTTEAFGR